MGTLGGYLRLVLGILLSVEVMRIYFLEGKESFFAVALAFAFLASTSVYFIRRMSLE